MHIRLMVTRGLKPTPYQVGALAARVECSAPVAAAAGYCSGAGAALHLGWLGHKRLRSLLCPLPAALQNPNITIGQPTIVIIPEYKEAAAGPKVRTQAA